MTYDKMRQDYERMREADKNRIVDEWKAANGYNDLLAAYSASVSEADRLRKLFDDAGQYLLAEEERRKLTGDALVAEDKLGRIAAIVNGAFNGESPLDREQRATKALAAVAEALGVPF